MVKSEALLLLPAYSVECTMPGARKEENGATKESENVVHALKESEYK